jgi:glyoxylase-like metal-dependent hydrolase (beta-lactamase superfamily II)
MSIPDVLEDTYIYLHPAERYFLTKFCRRGPVRVDLAQNPQMWKELKGVAGHHFGSNIWVVPLKSPTLPPAKHTNMLVLGGPGLVIDPAAYLLDERKRALALLRRINAIAGPLQAIWLTHHHYDHVGAASWLADHLGLPIWGHGSLTRLGSVRIARAFEDGQQIETIEGQDTGWVAVHTPGHAESHLCLWHPATKRLVAGDMVAGVGTILVDPDDGDMATYLASLRKLQLLGPEILFPAHGPALAEGHAVLGRYVEHRLAREQKLVDSFDSGPTLFRDLLTRTYDDVPEQIYPLAARSLTSHLRKLMDDGVVLGGEEKLYWLKKGDLL